MIVVHAQSFMSTAITSPTRRGRCHPSLTPRSLQFRVGMKTTILVFFSSFARISTSFRASIGQHRHGRQLSIDAHHAYAATRESPARSASRRLTWRALSNELSQVTVDVKRSGRNPVDTSQVLLLSLLHLQSQIVGMQPDVDVYLRSFKLRACNSECGTFARCPMALNRTRRLFRLVLPLMHTKKQSPQE